MHLYFLKFYIKVGGRVSFMYFFFVTFIVCTLYVFQLYKKKKKKKEKEFTKYLGIVIDNKLTYYKQIEHIAQKLNKGNCLLAKLRHYVPNKILKNLYNAHIQPLGLCSLI